MEELQRSLAGWQPAIPAAVVRHYMGTAGCLVEDERVLKAVAAVNGELAEAVVGMDATEQASLDALMIVRHGDKNRRRDPVIGAPAEGEARRRAVTR